VFSVRRHGNRRATAVHLAELARDVWPAALDEGEGKEAEAESKHLAIPHFSNDVTTTDFWQPLGVNHGARSWRP